MDTSPTYAIILRNIATKRNPFPLGSSPVAYVPGLIVVLSDHGIFRHGLALTPLLHVTPGTASSTACLLSTAYIVSPQQLQTSYGVQGPIDFRTFLPSLQSASTGTFGVSRNLLY